MPTASRTVDAVRRRAAAATAGLAAVALAVLGLPATAHAASAPAQTSPTQVSLARTASAPAPAAPTSDSRHRPSGTTVHTAAAPGSRAPKKSGTLTASCAKPAAGKAGCLAKRVKGAATGVGVQTAAAAPNGYGPSDLLSAYSLPADGGAGATIAIVVAYDAPTAEADLAVYRQQFGLPALRDGQLTKVNQRGGQSDYPTPDKGWATEAALDLDMVSAIAPQADIILVEADDNDIENLGAAVNRAVSLGADYVSNSYAAKESAAYDAAKAAQYYDHPGVALVAGSGDNGYGVEFPASAPAVTAVGGTSLAKDATTARGWTESAWSGAGSGCSVYQPKPALQADTGCANRSVADVSAVADPYTGVAVYDTFQSPGWSQYGGTSAATPIIASVYALAGPLAKDAHPVDYPYLDTDALHDVTSGSNGPCVVHYLCRSTTGYDGPTGLGTPNGTAAFTAHATGTLTGTVRDSAGKAVAGARIGVTGRLTTHTTTGADGTYRLTLPVGDYTVTATLFGYTSPSATSVSITDGGTTTRDPVLGTRDLVTISGTVKDGSGHGWPLASTIVLDDGSALDPVRTDATTGAYSLTVPADTSYTLHVTPGLSGYAERAVEVKAGKADLTRDIPLTAHGLAALGSAPGYTQHLDKAVDEHFTSNTAPDGWSTTTAAGEAWTFSSFPFDYFGGGTSGSASVGGTAGSDEDAYLLLPDLTAQAGKSLGVSFSQMRTGAEGTAEAQYSTDGGTTWTTVWSEHTAPRVATGSKGAFALPVSDEQRTVKLRLRFTTSDGAEWTISDLVAGNTWTDPVPGGLILGNTTSHSTGRGLDGATVALAARPSESTVTAAATGLGDRNDGHYYLFSPLTGRQTVTAAFPYYTTAKATGTVVANRITVLDPALTSGHIVASGDLSASVAAGGTAVRKLTLTNTGDGPAAVRLKQFAGTAGADKAAPAPAWGTVARLDSGHGVGGAYQGILYAGLGVSSSSIADSAFYAFDPGSGTWTRKADAPHGVNSAGSAFLNGKFYVTGGFSQTGLAKDTMVYDPSNDTWGSAATDPYNWHGVTTAVGGRLYQVGGSITTGFGFDIARTTSVYDPSTDSWSKVADYPIAVGSPRCGAVGTGLICAGGAKASGEEVADAFSYDPASDTWTRIAALPLALTEAQAVGSNGELVFAGGVTDRGSKPSKRVFAYNPQHDSWAQLPDLPEAQFEGVGIAGAEGFYAVGGAGPKGASASATAVLSGYGNHAAADEVPWLTTGRDSVVIPAGHSITLPVRLDARKSPLNDAGTLTASLGFESTTTLDPIAPIGIRLTVTASDKKE